MEGVVVALGWAAVGQLTGTAWASLVWLRRAPDPHGLFAHVMRDLNLASLVPLAVALVLAAVATVSLAQGRPYLRLYPDRLKAAGLFVTQVVPWSALSPLDAWTPAAPWVRRRGNEPILVFPLGRPELVTYRSRVPFAGWVARRRTKGQWLALSHRRLAVTVEGITEATREYAQRANRVPDAR